MIHDVDQLMINDEGKPDIDFLKEELNLISDNFEVFLVNDEKAIEKTLAMAGNFLRTGELLIGRDMMSNPTTRLFDTLLTRVKEGKLSWSVIWSRYSAAKELKKLGWDEDTIEGLHREMKKAFKESPQSAIEYLESLYDIGQPTQ